MHIHILGICGTFMGGLAALAREAGHRVTGCDAGVYPPMSDQLRALGIDLIEGFEPDQIAIAPYCTYQNPDLFFSYRREKQKKVQWSGIVSWG
jgi:UDP-N-acetylmuramate-alanine ligase